MTSTNDEPETKNIEDHDQLTAALPAILRKLNEEPDLARLLMVNPLLVLEDLGYKLTPDLQQHIRKTLGFPVGLARRLAELRQELKRQVKKTNPQAGSIKPPTNPRERAELVFETLGVRITGPAPETLTVEELRPLRSLHPAVATLYEIGRLERGGLLYSTRAKYESHKAGAVHHPWIKRLRFRVDG